MRILVPNTRRTMVATNLPGDPLAEITCGGLCSPRVFPIESHSQTVRCTERMCRPLGSVGSASQPCTTNGFYSTCSPLTVALAWTLPHPFPTTSPREYWPLSRQKARFPDSFPEKHPNLTAPWKRDTPLCLLSTSPHRRKLTCPNHPKRTSWRPSESTFPGVNSKWIDELATRSEEPKGSTCTETSPLPCSAPAARDQAVGPGVLHAGYGLGQVAGFDF